METKIPGGICEVCGAEAVRWSGNVIEIEPFIDSDGMKWRRWERGDPPGHWRCADHERTSHETLIDGTVEGGEESSPEGKEWATKAGL